MNSSLRRGVFSIITASLLMTTPTSCFRHYYKIAKQPSSASPQTIDSLQKQSRYFILRSGDYAWHMKNISVSDDQKTIKCELASLPFEHGLHMRKGEHHENMQYKMNKPTRVVLNEVHFFIAPEPFTKDGVITLPVDKIQRIEVIEKDGGRTVASYVFGAMGIVGTIAAGALIIAALTSCPFVSPYDGNEFSLQGEIYGGAVYPQLSRHDYIKLNMAPTRHGNLQLKISNELKEVQHTDLAELITITHSKDVDVLSDQEGNIYSIKDARQPLTALTKNNKDVTDLLAAKDGRIMEMNDSSSVNTVVLHFNKPSQINKGKLVLTIKNTFWLDRLYGKMLEGFGSYYNTFVANQKNKTADELNRWTEDQKIPMAISIKTNKGWKQVTGLKTTGPVAFRDMVVPLDLADSDEPFVDIKISSGFMFWELDYVAIDYSENEILNVEKQLPVRATDESGKNVSRELAGTDGNYLIQPEPGNVTTITYNYHKPLNGNVQTYILHSNGWYETTRDFKGRPDIAFLQQFKKAGAFARFSLESYCKEAAVRATTAKN
jgi:hypothetical protein